MTPKEITMQIVKSIGLYETCRLEATFTLDEGDDLTNAFKSARQQLENAFDVACDVKNDNRKVLEFYTKEFDRVCKALHEGKTDIKELRKYFKMSDAIIEYFKVNKLI